jgi:hypothetical protein
VLAEDLVLCGREPDADRNEPRGGIERRTAAFHARASVDEPLVDQRDDRPSWGIVARFVARLKTAPPLHHHHYDGVYSTIGLASLSAAFSMGWVVGAAEFESATSCV